MASKAGKGRQAAAVTSRPDAPSAPSASRGRCDNDANSSTGSLDSEVVKSELLPSLRSDFVSMMKTEVRAVLESEMAAIRADVRAVRTGFEDFKSAMNMELTMLRNTLGETERSLTTCSDDIETLKQEVKRLGTLTDSLQTKCEDLESRSPPPY